MANLKSTTINDTGFLQLPSGTTAQRPGSPSAGEIRFNTNIKVTEWYDEELDAWFPTGVIPPVATGGDSVEDVDIDGVTYRIHSFTTVGESTFTVTRGSSVDYLIVAGGGGGAGGGEGGGAGAGGVLHGSKILIPSTYNIFVGEGGLGSSNREEGDNGQISYALGEIAFGGGAGGATGNPGGGVAGGSGGAGGGTGGGFSDNDGAPGTIGQGYSGGNGTGNEGGGGGGARRPGQNAQSGVKGGDGGSGLCLNITGTLKGYGGGGGGEGVSDAGTEGFGGFGGGGSGQSSSDPEDGEPNTGGGGGGGGAPGGNGGSGIVVIRYRIS